MSKPKTSPKQTLSQLEDTLEQYLVDKSPVQIPENIKELLVTFGPWLMLIGLVAQVPTLLGAIGYLSGGQNPYAFIGRPDIAVSLNIRLIFQVAGMILQAIAIPGLLKRSQAGWNLLYYSVLVITVGALITFNIFGAILGFVLSMYFLFQIRSYYR